MSTYNGIPMRTFALPASKYPVKATYPMIAKGVTVHNTYNDATAENEINYMQRNGNYTSYHAAIDDIGVIFGVPLNRSSWHAGDGSNGYGNRNHLSFEVCYSKNGGEKYRRAEANAVKVLAQVLYINKWGMSKLKKHQDWSGKNCPHRILDEKRWGEFTSKVAKELARLNGGVVDQVSNPATPVNPKPTPEPTPGQPKGKSISQLASEVIAGKHGSGHENRRKSLGISQAEYEKVRAEVNKQAGVITKPATKKSVAQMAQEVLEGRHGNGHDARRKSLGIGAVEYGKVSLEVNRRLSGGASNTKSINQMATEVIKGNHGSGHANRRKSLNISQSQYDKVRAEVNKRL